MFSFDSRCTGRRFAVCRQIFFVTMITLIVVACTKQNTVLKKSTPSSKATSSKKTIPSIPYTIQLGAFQSSTRAIRMTNDLKKEGLDAYFYEDKSGLTKVRFGRFNTLAEAKKQALTLKTKGVIKTFYILQPAKSSQSSKTAPRLTLEKQLVKTAKGFIGIPYLWGGTSAEKGFDCSGLTMTVYRLNGLQLPRTAAYQYQAGNPVSSHALKPADLIFFATNGDNKISHVGIYSGNDKFIHAPGTGKYIRTDSMSNSYFKKHYRGARRYF